MAAGFVVEVDDVQCDVGAMGVDQAQQGDAVGAAADGDGVSAGGNGGGGVFKAGGHGGAFYFVEAE